MINLITIVLIISFIMVYRGLGLLEIILLKHFRNVKGIDYIAPAVPYSICAIMTTHYGYFALTILLIASLLITIAYRYDTKKMPSRANSC